VSNVHRSPLRKTDRPPSSFVGVGIRRLIFRRSVTRRKKKHSSAAIEVSDETIKKQQTMGKKKGADDIQLSK